MIEILVAYEHEMRIGFFVGTLLVMGMLETIFPKKKRVATRARRWISNIGIVFAGAFFVRITTIILPVAMASVAQERGWGILNQAEMPILLSILVTVVVLDFVVYLQHAVFHYLPLLWRLHKVHHTDMDLDVTSGNRFHPVEILISVGVKLSAITLLGPLPAAVILFEIILNGMAQFNHANVRLPKGLDSVLRLLFVTPDVHRVHHSIIATETNSNFGFNLSIWDRIFGTYQAQPKGGHARMTIGLPEYRDQKRLGLHWLLAIPFVKTKRKK